MPRTVCRRCGGKLRLSRTDNPDRKTCDKCRELAALVDKILGLEVEANDTTEAGRREEIHRRRAGNLKHRK